MHLQPRPNFVDDGVGRRSAGGEPDERTVIEPLRPQFGGGGDEIGRAAQTTGQFDEFTAIITIWTANDDYYVRLGCQVAQRLLAVLGWLTHRIDKVNVRIPETPAHCLDQLMHALQRL